MKPSTLILNHLLPRDSIELGRLVTNIHDPIQDYCQPSPFTLPEDAIHTQRLESFNALLQNAKSLSLSTFLTTMLSGNWAASRGSAIDIRAAAYETQRLGNCEDILQSACKLDSVKHWLERAARRKRNVYIICGFKVLVDARVRQARLKSYEKGGSVQVPTALISAGAGAPIPVGDLLDVGLGGSLKNQSHENGEYVASGEHVFAIQYRKLGIRKFSTRDVDPTYLLEGSRWKVFLSSRGGSGSSETEDGMGVEAADPVTADDIRKTCEHVDIDGEEILFCPS